MNTVLRPTSDTIAAIATASGRGGVGIVRISGPASRHIGELLAGRTSPPRVATFCRFLDAQQQPIDDGLMLFFAGPSSYTGEDTLELQGHGSPVVLQALLQRCLQLGARLAEPGEFTRRAFLNDKLDLAQAEGVADLIEARTSAAARAALRSLEGEFSRAVHDLTDQLTELRALIEATLDFPEEEIDGPTRQQVSNRLARLQDDLEILLKKSQRGAMLRRGMTVVLVGQPNVGKSSLLNQLAGLDRAIVTDVPGTTRDSLRENIEIAGVPLNIVDTAGLRETDDQVERIGIERTWAEIQRADVIVHLLDARSGWRDEDTQLEQGLPTGCEHLVLVNKCDLIEAEPHVELREGRRWLWLSARHGSGVDLLRQELLRLAGAEQEGMEDSFLARERHLQALYAAQVTFESAAQNLKQVELAAEELRLAQEALAEITGEVSADDLLGEIFSRFCIGK